MRTRDVIWIPRGTLISSDIDEKYLADDLLGCVVSVNLNKLLFYDIKHKNYTVNANEVERAIVHLPTTYTRYKLLGTGKYSPHYSVMENAIGKLITCIGYGHHESNWIIEGHPGKWLVENWCIEGLVDPFHQSLTTIY